MRQTIASAVLALALGLGLACAGDDRAQRAPEAPRVTAADAGTPGEVTAPEPPTAPAALEAGAFDCRPQAGEAIGRLREDLRKLSLVHWNSARRTAAQALCTLADGLENAPPPRARPARTEALRAEAARLGNVEQLPYRHSAHARAGLEAALEALDELAEIHRVRDARSWLVSARRSVAQIDPEGLFELQRAPIQDAFRTVSAAFTVVLEGVPREAPSR